MGRQTGPGKIYRYGVTPGVLAALYNFDVDGDQMKPEHQSWLIDNRVAGILAGGGRLALLAQASRTGTSLHNYLLSKRRGDDVIRFLRQQVGGRFQVFRDRRVGEDRAGSVDDIENEWFRSVLLLAVPQQPPPRPPPPVPPQPEFQLPCKYYRFEIAYATGLRLSWVISLQGGDAVMPRTFDSDTPGFVQYMKPAYAQWAIGMGQAMREHWESVRPDRLQAMLEFYPGEVVPNGPYERINSTTSRINDLQRLRREQGCSGGDYDPPQLGRRSPSPPDPRRAPRGQRL